MKKGKKYFNWKCKKNVERKNTGAHIIYSDKVFKIFTFFKLLELELNYICAITVLSYT